jgi:hypothetical protein
MYRETQSIASLRDRILLIRLFKRNVVNRLINGHIQRNGISITPACVRYALTIGLNLKFKAVF